MCKVRPSGESCISGVEGREICFLCKQKRVAVWADLLLFCSLYETLQTLHFYKLSVWGNRAASKSTGDTFPAKSADAADSVTFCISHTISHIVAIFMFAMVTYAQRCSMFPLDLFWGARNLDYMSELSWWCVCSDCSTDSPIPSQPLSSGLLAPWDTAVLKLGQWTALQRPPRDQVQGRVISAANFTLVLLHKIAPDTPPSATPTLISQQPQHQGEKIPTQWRPRWQLAFLAINYFYVEVCALFFGHNAFAPLIDYTPVST